MAYNKLRFPADTLVPAGGEMYCHIFENRSTGLARNLFWSITVEFQPIEYDESEWTCSMTCEWIPWPVRRWQDLDGKHLKVSYGDDGIESSFYLAQHDLGGQTELGLRHLRDNLFKVNMQMVVDFHGLHADDEDPALHVQAETELPFVGLIDSRDNLFPKPSTSSEFMRVASEFVEPSVYREPEPWHFHATTFPPAF